MHYVSFKKKKKKKTLQNLKHFFFFLVKRNIIKKTKQSYKAQGKPCLQKSLGYQPLS